MPGHRLARRMASRSASATSRGEQTSSRCCLNAPSTSAGCRPRRSRARRRPRGRADVAHELLERARQRVVVAASTGSPGAARQRAGGARAPRGDEAKRRRRCHDDREAVRNEAASPVAGRRPLVLQRGDGIRERVRDVHARAAETDAGDRCGERHVAPRVDVRAVGDRAAQVRADELDRLGAQRSAIGCAPW